MRILIVDDDEMMLFALRDILELDGHSIAMAAGGVQGLAIYRASEETIAKFDLVITDLTMPKVDGQAFAASIRSTTSPPVILLTGWKGCLDPDLADSVDCVLNKPPKIEELRNAMRSLAGPSFPRTKR